MASATTHSAEFTRSLPARKQDMKKRSSKQSSLRLAFLLGCATASVLASLVAATGCQTQIAGMTLPSGYYLQHPPQYFPPDPDFPLQNELNAQQAAAAQGLPGGPPRENLPAPVPPRVP